MAKLIIYKDLNDESEISSNDFAEFFSNIADRLYAENVYANFKEPELRGDLPSFEFQCITYKDIRKAIFHLKNRKTLDNFYVSSFLLNRVCFRIDTIPLLYFQ